MDSISVYYFLFVTLFSSILLVNIANPISAILLLINVILHLAICLIILGADFLGLAILIVYVGAIAVLFLFVIMMLNLKEVVLSTSALNYMPLSIILFCIFAMLSANWFADTLAVIISSDTANANLLTILNAPSYIKRLGFVLICFDFVPLILISITLLIAMVGAIILTLYHDINIRRQNIMSQNLRTTISAIRMLD